MHKVLIITLHNYLGTLKALIVQTLFVLVIMGLLCILGSNLLDKGVFNNYVDRKWWMGVQLNV